VWKKSLALSIALVLCASPALARSGHGNRKHHGGHERHGRYDHRGDGRHGQGYRGHHDGGRGHRGYGYAPRHGYSHGWRPSFYIPYRWGHRPHHRHHHHHHSDDAFLWLGLATFGVGALALLSQQQRWLHEQAYWGATTAPIGRPVAWDDGAVAGTWTPVREGYAAGGEYCREFQHDVRVGGRSERGYGTACWRPDGSWEIVN
jgi:surface antigen